VGEDILFGPADQIEFGAGGEEIETGLCNVGAAFTGEAAFQNFMGAVQVTPLVSETYPLDQAIHDIERAAAGNIMKVLLRCT
jgi:hypothetical protein